MYVYQFMMIYFTPEIEMLPYLHDRRHAAPLRTRRPRGVAAQPQRLEIIAEKSVYRLGPDSVSGSARLARRASVRSSRYSAPRHQFRCDSRPYLPPFGVNDACREPNSSHGDLRIGAIDRDMGDSLAVHLTCDNGSVSLEIPKG